METVERDCPSAPGHADTVTDLGDRADLRVGALVTGDEQHALLVTRLDGDRDVHIGEDDDVVERYEEQ
jgi:hypothetical protein